MLDFDAIESVINDVTPSAFVENIVFNVKLALKTKSGKFVHLTSKSGEGANHSFNIVPPINVNDNHPFLKSSVGDVIQAGTCRVVDEEDWCAGLASGLNWFVNEEDLKTLIGEFRTLVGYENKVAFCISGDNFWVVSSVLIILVVKEDPNPPGTLTIH